MFFFYWFITILYVIAGISQSTSQSTLKLIHVLFRHGNRTANGYSELYPKDPYLNETYFPFGLGQLTNAGKRREYSIGQALRARYDRFFGDFYYPEIIEPRSTDFNRTKMSLELVLASLFPPRGLELWYEDNDKKHNGDGGSAHGSYLNWQPVPYNYFSASKDKVLMGSESENYKKLYNAYTNSPQQQSKYNKYEKVFQYISNSTGLNVKSFREIYNLYFGLSTEEEWGFKLPRWTVPVWPKVITDLSVKEYFVQTGTPDLIKEGTGYLLKKIIDDSEKKLNEENVPDKISKKIYLYSAHENNLANFLIALGVFDNPKIPNYGAYVVVEVHRISNKPAVRILYENYVKDEIQVLNLPNCNSYCDFNVFVNNLRKYLPSD